MLLKQCNQTSKWKKSQRSRNFSLACERRLSLQHDASVCLAKVSHERQGKEAVMKIE
jgi:hypothetical protein